MKYFFLHSHYGAPYKEVLESLSKIPGTYAVRSETTYDHPSDLIRLAEKDRWAVRFIDTILENKEIQSQALEKSVVNFFLLGNSYEHEDYLRFRLRRMYEIWRRNGGIVIGPGINGWIKLEEMFDRKINKVELISTSTIVDKYLAKFALHMT